MTASPAGGLTKRCRVLPTAGYARPAMRAFSLLLAAGSATFVSVLVAACGAPPTASIGLVLKTEHGLLDEANGVKLRVFEGEASACQEDGSAEVPDDAQTFNLGQEDCPAGATWCGEIELDRDKKSRVFYVSVEGPSNSLLAQGCAAAKIDQDPVTVGITVVRFVPPGCCNDGVLQAGEQCDSGEEAPVACDGSAGDACKGVPEDAVCSCDCTTKAIPADRRADEPVSVPGTKTDLALAFSRGAAELSNALRCAFTDTGAQVVGGSDIAVRYLDADGAPFDPVEHNDVADPLAVPLKCDAPDAPGSGRRQKSPALANVSSSSTALVYLNDQAASTVFEGYLVNLGAEGCAETSPVLFSDSGAIDSVDIAAGPTGIALIVYAQDGAVRGRFWGETTGFGAIFDIAPLGASPRVAGSASGWAVTYTSASGTDSDGVVARTVNLVDNQPNVGVDIVVNEVTQGAQDQPDIAMLSDGRFAVTWRSGGDIFAQRFSAGGFKSEGDQDAPINTVTDGAQGEPAIEGSGATGAFYVVAWSDAGSGEIRSRYLAQATGYLFNSVTGQNDEFTASPLGVVGARSKPAISVGGNAYVAIGWQDGAADGAGVYVRRFPLPASQ